MNEVADYDPYVAVNNFRHHHENMFRVIIVRVVHMTVRASPPMALFCAACSPINFCFEDSQKRAFCAAMKCFPIIRRPAEKIVSQRNIMTESSGIFFSVEINSFRVTSM